MARKKHRDIVIDGENWSWMFNAALDSDGDPYGTQTLRIWRNKKLVLEKYFYYDRAVLLMKVMTLHRHSVKITSMMP